MKVGSDDAFLSLKEIAPEACSSMNDFSKEILRTRGGRIGSGMGGLLEALWGYMANKLLRDRGIGCELSWLPGHRYGDFICVERDSAHRPLDSDSELLRIEVKTMNFGADESKAHFDVLRKELDPDDALLVVVWTWKQMDEVHFSPFVVDLFFNRSAPIAELRDSLHVVRGGSFIMGGGCPDGCEAGCLHIGEPLNAAGKRERMTGPSAARVSEKVSYSANFGGMVRMLRTDGPAARRVLRDIRRSDPVADEYISFIHRNYPAVEKNHFSLKEWKEVAEGYGIGCEGGKGAVQEMVRRMPDYMDRMRTMA